LSHELRTPLNAVIGWTQILKQDLSDAVRASKAVDVIDRNARQQARLISDLLDISRITSGTMQLDMRSVDVRTVIDAAIEAVTPAAVANGVSLQMRAEGNSRAVQADAARLQQVVWNLLVNAIKFTPREGTIEIVLVAADAHAEIRITDTGIGIDPSLLPHIFDGFRQGDVSLSRVHGGLGLGLTIVKHVIELHGGGVRASSQGRGQGSTFVVELPYGQADPKRALDAQTALVGGVDHTARLLDMRVLIVDDEPDAIEMLQRLLEDRSAFVVTASSAQQALDVLTRQTFDVIVSDIAMPRRDGYDFIREVRRRRLTTPAIALTAFARGEDRERALAAGYQAHVSKPVNVLELLNAIVRLAYATDAS
jgi:CheY-like chemotaxis protein